jgi:hypothetical protein
MARSQKTKGGKSRKAGREKRKKLVKGNDLSKYVRGLISFDQYAKNVVKKHV